MEDALFPELVSASTPGNGLVGIAKLAAQGQVVETKRRVDYRDLVSRSLLARTSGGRVPFQWSINPYRGCEFGCKYCYARYTHEFMELRDPELFETRIFVKEIDWIGFERELDQVGADEAIGIGTATDPYQPAERRYRLTRKVLEILSRKRGYRIYLTTKSDLVAQDAQLLAQVSKRNEVSVSMTITTVDTELARLLEPYAPRPDLRLSAVHQLSQAGVTAGVLGSPILPLINDRKQQLEGLADRAAKAGAAFFSAQVLFLQPCARRVFFPFIAEQFPELFERYVKRYGRGAYLRGRYPELMQVRVDAAREKAGLRRRVEVPKPEDWQGFEQLRLF